MAVGSKRQGYFGGEASQMTKTVINRRLRELRAIILSQAAFRDKGEKLFRSRKMNEAQRIYAMLYFETREAYYRARLDELYYEVKLSQKQSA